MVSGVHRMNEVNPCRARLVPGWVTVISVTSQLGQLSLASLRCRLIEYQLRMGVRAEMSPLCDPVWRVSSRSGEACWRTTPFTFTLPYHRI